MTFEISPAKSGDMDAMLTWLKSTVGRCEQNEQDDRRLLTDVTDLTWPHENKHALYYTVQLYWCERYLGSKSGINTNLIIFLRIEAIFHLSNTHACTHACTHARTHAHTHIHTHTNKVVLLVLTVLTKYRPTGKTPTSLKTPGSTFVGRSYYVGAYIVHCSREITT